MVTRWRQSTSERLRSCGLEQEPLVTSPYGRSPSFSSEPWFNVTSMSEYRYTLFDRASGNFLDWFGTLAEAKETRARWVEAAPQAAEDLEIWDDEKGVRIELDPETLRPAPAA